MKKIVIASGKGGTGKTTVAINFATFLADGGKNKVMLLDCDVEAPNDNLFINAIFDKVKDVEVVAPKVDTNRCTLCGKCVSVCNYNAIAKVKDQILIFNELCHSCGACGYLCPQEAINMQLKKIGTVELSSNNKPFSFGQGTLSIGESLAPMVIKHLKSEIKDDVITLLDASPGTTCPVVKTMEDADYCLLVTEPTPFGLNDLKLAAALSQKLKIPTGIIINRSYGQDEIIQDFAKESNIPIVGKIPFSFEYAKSYSVGKVLINHFSELKDIFETIFENMQKYKQVPNVSSIKEHDIKKEDDLFQNISEQASNYKEIVVISGKGGTGKTTITSALASLLENIVITDNDVDASNLYLLSNPKTLLSKDFVGGKKGIIDQTLCIKCGKCFSICHFDAIKKENDSFVIDEIGCEGCGFCFHVCREKAIAMNEAISGKWYISNSDFGPFSHAKLGIGEENSGKLVSLVREHARNLAEKNNAKLVLSDGPPGTGCPVISSVTGVDLILIVTEPTKSGIHDLTRALELAKHFRIPSRIIINKYDLNLNLCQEIKELSKLYDTSVIGEIPFDKTVYDALMKKKRIMEIKTGKAYDAILALWDKLKLELYKHEL